jgi:DNA repair protein RadD
MLRDYQQRAIDELYAWLRDNEGDPVLVLPTGSGKSHIVAALCSDALKNWQDTRILMTTHVKELVQQNAEKMRQHWANAPMGVYSAGLKSRDIDAITFASIQSIEGKHYAIGHRDLMIVDEAHMINNQAHGRYRRLIDALRQINPAMRVIGLTATPYRLGQGLLTQGESALFDGIIEPVSIAELVGRGYLAPLKSKHTEAMIDTSKIKKRGGEYIAKDMNREADKITQKAVLEIMARADQRKHWLLFCSGVDHSYHVRDELRRWGVNAETITGKTPHKERERLIDQFRTGTLQALTNADVLTTGFDAPDTDLIAMLRPTMSAALYVQMAGRGMRLKQHTDHCLVLDFAGNVETHGPITGVTPPRMQSGEGGGEAPVKVCPQCDELLHASVMTCTECGHQFPKNEKPLMLGNADIMGIEPLEMSVTDWQWRKHVSRKSGKEMVKVTYYGGLSDAPITEYFAITHEGYAGIKALASLARLAKNAGLPQSVDIDEMEKLAQWLNTGRPPALIQYHKRGKFYDIDHREWS